jgi:hypothetical protein
MLPCHIQFAEKIEDSHSSLGGKNGFQGDLGMLSPTGRLA